MFADKNGPPDPEKYVFKPPEAFGRERCIQLLKGLIGPSPD